jgi:hypothetical protein
VLSEGEAITVLQSRGYVGAVAFAFRDTKFLGAVPIASPLFRFHAKTNRPGADCFDLPAVTMLTSIAAWNDAATNPGRPATSGEALPAVRLTVGSQNASPFCPLYRVGPGYRNEPL